MAANLMDVFDPSEAHPGAAGEAVIVAALWRLRFRPPTSYLELLRRQNGGRLQRTRFDTDFATSWAPDHFVVDTLLGVGDAWMALDGEVGSDYMICEWVYPDIGLVVGVTPSGGHDTVMLDYRHSGPQGEPRVAYVDEDRVPRIVADSMTEFLGLLRSDED
jgi:hypothetical protein